MKLAVIVVALFLVAVAEGSRRRHLTTKAELEEYLQSLQQPEPVLLQNGVPVVQGRQAKENANGSIWVVLVAGSNGWYNYRHQSDICHAYQIVKSHGIPASNVITFMYDDIAHNDQNPTPGVIINKMGGPNVYPGVIIDYKGDDVTPENFLKVLTGDASTGKKVLQSGANDRVFVYFTDHGDTGILAFPNEYLMADDLSKALHTMNTKNMYKEFAFYVEACESGSMFLPNFLPASLNIYGLTAANDQESSYACYLDDALNTYLGDCFSVYWMEDTDAHDIQAESLQVQFLRVQTQTTTSHVTQYGALTYVSDMVGQFQGDKNPSAAASKQIPSTPEERRAAPQEEVELNILLNKHRLAKTLQEQKKHAQAIRDHIAERERVSSLFERIISHVFPGKEFLHAMNVKRGGAVNFECYKPVLKRFNEICIPIHASSPALNNLYKLANLCNLGTTQEKIMEALQATCL